MHANIEDYFRENKMYCSRSLWIKWNILEEKLLSSDNIPSARIYYNMFAVCQIIVKKFSCCQCANGSKLQFIKLRFSIVLFLCTKLPIFILDLRFYVEGLN